MHKENYNNFNYNESWYLEISKGFYCCSFLAKENNEYLGEVTLTWSITSDILYQYIVSISVLPRYRKLGVGQQLVMKAINESSTYPIYLHVNTSNFGAIKLYQKNGFIAMCTFKSFYPNGDAFLMRRLSPKKSSDKNEIFEYLKETPKSELLMRPQIFECHVSDLIPQNNSEYEDEYEEL